MVVLYIVTVKPVPPYPFNPAGVCTGAHQPDPRISDVMAQLIGHTNQSCIAHFSLGYVHIVAMKNN